MYSIFFSLSSRCIFYHSFFLMQTPQYLSITQKKTIISRTRKVCNMSLSFFVHSHLKTNTRTMNMPRTYTFNGHMAPPYCLCIILLCEQSPYHQGSGHCCPNLFFCLLFYFGVFRGMGFYTSSHIFTTLHNFSQIFTNFHNIILAIFL